MAETEDLRRRILELEEALSRVRGQVQGVEDEIALTRRAEMYRSKHIGAKDLDPDVQRDLKYYKNLVYNSSFEMPKPTRQPDYWDGGVCSADAAWYGTCSLKLTPSQAVAQTSDARIQPSWYSGLTAYTRVAFMQKFGKVRCEVLNQSASVLHTVEYPYASDWPYGRRTFAFLVDTSLTTHIYLRFTNIDATNDCYIDAVQVEPDVTRKWPGLYSDGPFSGAYAPETTASAFGDEALSFTTIFAESALTGTFGDAAAEAVAASAESALTGTSFGDTVTEVV